MNNELNEFDAVELKPVELQGNGLNGNGISCDITHTDFDLYLSELSI